jgi:AcrR family transcriptional regulator
MCDCCTKQGKGEAALPRRDKRADIVNAGIRIFSRQGFHRCSVEDILQEANVARATFYSYFDSKKDLFVELIDGILNSMYEIMSRQMEGQPTSVDGVIESAKEAVLELYEFFRDNLDFSAIYIQEVMGMNPEIDLRIVEWQNRTATFLSGIIQKGIEKGLFREVEVDVIGRLIAGAVQHLGLTLFLYTEEIDIPRVAESVADYLINGLAARD